jgi:D-tyrosyl-tRNA(Tyr) deacylase
MRAIIQRVANASVTIDGVEKAAIGTGLLVLLGISIQDNMEDVSWLCQKIIQMRIFNDPDGKMNLALADVKGEVLLISQFTLHASTKKGNRPSFINAARQEQAIPLYEAAIQELKRLSGNTVKTGSFGADMKVSLLNDGPVTIVIDSKQKE